MKRLSNLLVVLSLLFGFTACTAPEQPAQEIAVESISIDHGDQILNVGESMLLSATVLPADATDKSINWKSSDENIVMVSSGGKILALAVGMAQVIAEAGGKTDFIKITVKEGSSAEDNPSLTVTGEATDITSTSAKLFGYANLPLELGDAAFGIIYSTEKTPTVENGALKRAYNVDTNNMYAVTVTGLSSGTTYYYSSYIQNGQIYRFGAVKSFSTPVVQVESVSLDVTEFISHWIGSSVTLNATVLPEDATDKSVVWSSSDDSIATVDQNGLVTLVSDGTATIYARTNDQNKIASCTVKLVPIPMPGTIDLGLTSGVKWASFNLGASKPEEYGDYYAWGETETKSNYSWSTYKFGTSYSGPFSKYNTSSSYGTVDNKTVLDPEDDAAHVALGGSWRMPTDEEWTELRTQCTWTWTTENGVNGRRVTGPNGNSIFLPAAGCRFDTDLYNAGSFGSYWSSSLSTGYPDCAWYVCFSSDNVDRYNGGSRDNGLSVRPVSE